MHDPTDEKPPTNGKPLRLLVVMPSWVGDAVMATPALRLLRESLRGSFIGALVRPGIDQVLAGSPFFDQVHVERARGIMGPKLVANKVRPVRYDTALLLTNSFSTALITRLAYIPRRVGYDRDGRGVLLTDRLEAPRRAGGKGFAPVSAVEYYLDAARAMLRADAGVSTSTARLQLGTTDEEEQAGAEILRCAGVMGDRPVVILNPGGNNPAKRWPADRFAAVAAHLIQRHAMDVLINGSPGEADLVSDIASATRALADAASGGPEAPNASNAAGHTTAATGPKMHNHRAVIAELPRLGITLGALKAITRRCSLMITNDTGPRHIAAAMGVPVVSLFGPTDPRWTTLPPGTPEVCLVADPTLPPEEVADDHPERCRIDRIEVSAVIAAAERLLPIAPG